MSLPASVLIVLLCVLATGLTYNLERAKHLTGARHQLYNEGTKEVDSKRARRDTIDSVQVCPEGLVRGGYNCYPKPTSTYFYQPNQGESGIQHHADGETRENDYKRATVLVETNVSIWPGGYVSIDGYRYPVYYYYQPNQGQSRIQHHADGETREDDYNRPREPPVLDDAMVVKNCPLGQTRRGIYCYPVGNGKIYE